MERFVSLAGAHLGSEEEEARQWLVVDTQQHVLYLASADEARRHLARQWPVYDGPPIEYTPEDLKRLLANLEEISTPPDLHERVTEARREARANYRPMMGYNHNTAKNRVIATLDVSGCYVTRRVYCHQQLESHSCC
jgi:hypothetical protein